MCSTLVLALALAACAGTPPLGSDPGLDGAWRLVSAQAFDAGGALVYDPDVQTGLLVVADGRYSFLWTRAPRPAAATPWAATEPERLVSFATMIAHAGRLTAVASDTVRADAQAAKSPEFVGGHETFALVLDGDTLRLTAVWAEAGEGTPVPFYAAGGRQDYVFVRAR
ncbi:lipocalin-like domain-containing protein [Rubrivirga sp.]|uniref:lipocalin-like domain-containing protein n=1 Tax=Rubrivirga sp. TaxID=1885344 RepID=UPI003B52BFEE